MFQEEKFAGMLLALQGETVIQEPRVSREDINSVITIAQDLTRTSAENAVAINKVQRGLDGNREYIEKIDQKSQELKVQVDIIAKKITEISDLRDQLKDQKTNFGDLKDNYDRFKSETHAFIDRSAASLDAMEKKNNETFQEAKEIKRIVDNFADNLVLSSTQITVETSSGFAKRPMPLLDILKDCCIRLNNIDSTNTQHSQMIAESQTAITTKADATVTFAVQSLDRDVSTIKSYLKKEEETGIHAIRRSCEALTLTVESIQSGMQEKIDRNTTEVIVQKKYEDIIEYLQDALQSSAEDEDNFKSILNSLDERMKLFAVSKCDKKDILPLQDSLMKTESDVTKSLKLLREFQKSHDSFTKDDILQMLDLKVDKEALEITLQELIRGKRKKVSQLVNDIKDQKDKRDEIFERTSSAQDFHTLGSKAMLASKSGSVKKIRSESVNMTDEVDSLQAGALAEGLTESIISGNISPGFNERSGSPSSDVYGNNGFPSNNPGSFRQPTERGRAGGVPPGGFPPANGAIALKKTNSSFQDNSALENKHEVGGFGDVQFARQASIKNTIVDDGKEYAITAGGGFNMRAKSPPKLMSKSLSNASSKKGDGAMIKGVNGHFYYTSDEAGENQSQVQQANSGGGSALAIGKGSAVVATKKS